MAERRVKKSKRADKDNEKATKEEYAIAKHVRFNCPTMDAKFVPMQNMVKCFYGNKAIDCLLDSKWAKTDKGDIHFTDRKSCVAFMEKLMMKGLLHRASKFEKSKKDRDKKKKKKEEDSAVDEEKKEKKDKKKLKEKEKDKDSKDGKEVSAKEESSEKEKDEKKGEEKEKKKEKKEKKERKLKLDMAEEQYFIDGEEIYVWIYDPVPFKTFFIGLLMVVGAIALCLFPLWPDWMRVAVYYISLVGASFVGFILVLVVIRGILFSAIWLVTMGKLHFWFLPNLTEDVGFFDSFKPTYTYKFYRAEDIEKEKLEQEKKKKRKEEKRKKKEVEEIDYDPEKEEGFEVVDRSEVEGSQDDLDIQGEDGQMEEGEEEENDGQSEEVEEEGTEEGSEEQEEEGDREGETKKMK